MFHLDLNAGLVSVLDCRISSESCFRFTGRTNEINPLRQITVEKDLNACGAEANQGVDQYLSLYWTNTVTRQRGLHEEHRSWSFATRSHIVKIWVSDF